MRTISRIIDLEWADYSVLGVEFEVRMLLREMREALPDGKRLILRLEQEEDTDGD